ncbi:hypothetical protein DSO57_1012086 [Entomophthora muscae]|uniref:Uncharacterized protein n=1 Tax=Entomophthora muscae TaxID=34485 RepID=A0ACC2TU77_9FUNG|nr:hypothetical protein DSO57_1012086 [Entomophthora muscae]
MQSFLPILLSLVSLGSADTLGDRCKFIKNNHDYSQVLTVTLPCQIKEEGATLDCKKGKCLVDLKPFPDCKDIPVHVKVKLDHRFTEAEINDLLNDYHGKEGYSGINLEVEKRCLLTHFLSIWKKGEKAITMTNKEYIRDLKKFDAFLIKFNVSLFVKVTDLKTPINTAPRNNMYLIINADSKEANSYASQHANKGFTVVTENTTDIENFKSTTVRRR